MAGDPTHNANVYGAPIAPCSDRGDTCSLFLGSRAPTATCLRDEDRTIACVSAEDAVRHADLADRIVCEATALATLSEDAAAYPGGAALATAVERACAR